MDRECADHELRLLVEGQIIESEQEHPCVPGASREHQLTEVGVVGDEQRPTRDGHGQNLIVGDARRQVADVLDNVAGFEESMRDATMEVLVGEDDQPEAIATTRSARRASIAYFTAASIPSLVRRG